MSRKAQGNRGELEACSFLEEQGLKLQQRNYRCNLGEIDLIMKAGETFVFVEVKVRNNESFATILEQISRQQCVRIRRCAQHYLIQQQLNEHVTSMRFDIVTIVRDDNELQWLPDAF